MTTSFLPAFEGGSLFPCHPMCPKHVTLLLFSFLCRIWWNHIASWFTSDGSLKYSTWRRSRRQQLTRGSCSCSTTWWWWVWPFPSPSLSTAIKLRFECCCVQWEAPVHEVKNGCHFVGTVKHMLAAQKPQVLVMSLMTLRKKKKKKCWATVCVAFWLLLFLLLLCFFFSRYFWHYCPVDC